MIVHFIRPRLGLAATSRKVKANRLKVSPSPGISPIGITVRNSPHVEEQFFVEKKNKIRRVGDSSGMQISQTVGLLF